MAIVVQTVITRADDTQPWVLLSENPSMFSQEEVSGILQPFTELIAAQPGFVSYTATLVDSKTFMSKREFDTVEHATACLALMQSSNPVVLAKNMLYTNKMAVNSIAPYSIHSEVVTI